MKQEYRITKFDNKILEIMWKDEWILIQILWDHMYWRRDIKAIRQKSEKVEFQEELFYNKSYIKSCCAYAFDDDFVEAYKIWRKERKLSPSYKTCYNEASEKRTFNKLAWKSKKIAIKMLENASASKWLVLFDLDKKEEESIVSKLKEENHKIEVKQQWISNEEEILKIQEDKKKISDYIENNPKIREQAKQIIDNEYPTVTGQYRENLIMTKARMIAKDLINN